VAHRHARQWRRLLGVDRLEGAQRAHQLRHGGTAAVHERFDAAHAVAVADQGDAESVVVPAPLLEQLDRHAVGARAASLGGGRDPPGEHGLHGPDAASFIIAASRAWNSAPPRPAAGRAFGPVGRA
jgi:hypothetical protein